jgi:hypothetical protein
MDLGHVRYSGFHPLRIAVWLDIPAPTYGNLKIGNKTQTGDSLKKTAVTVLIEFSNLRLSSP